MKTIYLRYLLSTFVCVLVAVPSAQAQSTASGRITGVVKDNQGGVVPGATVTLTGPSRLSTFVTTADGSFRFLDVLPGEYQLTVELAGFARFSRTNIPMIVGATVEIPVALQLAALEQEVTVSGDSPLLDTKHMGTATTLTGTELREIPTSRDPWALLRTVPGVVTDRVNVAGNESGQMGSFIAKGHQLSPRGGMSYKVNEATVLRASASRYAGRLTPGVIGYSNLSTANGFIDYGWNDVNGDHFVQPSEVLLAQGPISFGNGFNPAHPTAAVSPNVIDPDLQASRVTNVLAGIERELMTNFGVHVTYTSGIYDGEFGR
jgi:hypothetical protein